MAIGVTSNKLSLIDLTVLAHWTIQPRLLGVPGVANVSIWGRRERQLQVQVDPDKLRDENVTLMQVIKTAGNALWSSPLSFLEASTPGTGGWVETPNQRLGVRHVLPITTAKDLAKVPVEDLRRALFIGSGLVLAALLALLFNWCTALIAAVAVLISVIAAGTVLYVRGVTVNMMIIAGLLMALGAVIDDAIVGTGNILRRLRERRTADGDESTGRIILEASLEMRRPILYATVI